LVIMVVEKCQKLLQEGSRLYNNGKKVNNASQSPILPRALPLVGAFPQVLFPEESSKEHPVAQG